MSEKTVTDAVIAALVALNVPAVDLGTSSSTGAAVPSREDYVEITVTRRFGGITRVGGPVPDAVLWRVTTRPVCLRIDNAREYRRRVSLWEGTTLTVDSLMTSPISFETEEPIGPDDGFWSGLTTWTFSL